MPIKTTLKKLPTDNPLAKVVKVQHVNPETTSEFADLEKLRTDLDKKSYGLDLVKSLLNKDVQDVRLMAALENQGLVDKYPTVAERKVNNYNYRLYIPLDKSQSLVGTTVNYYVIDFAYGGDIFIFRFPIRLLNDRKTWKLDHYDATVEDGSFISGTNSLPKSLDIFSRTGSITDEGVLDIFKQYKIITNDDLTSLNFCITGHKISVIYSKEGKREVKEIAKVAEPVVVPAAPVKPEPVVVPKATPEPIVPDKPLVVPPTPVVTKKESKPEPEPVTKKEYKPEPEPVTKKESKPKPVTKPKQIVPPTPTPVTKPTPAPVTKPTPAPVTPVTKTKTAPPTLLNTPIPFYSDDSDDDSDDEPLPEGFQRISRPDVSIINSIKQDSCRLLAIKFDYDKFIIPGVEKTIPTSDIELVDIVGGPYASKYLLPLIEYNSYLNKITLWLYADYNDLYEKFKIKLKAGDERTKATINRVRLYNIDEYADYVKANKK